MHNEFYVDRAKCQCGFIWITPGSNPPDTISDSIICNCGTVQFNEGTLIGESLPFTEEEFKQAVADSHNISIENVIITKY